MVHELSKSHSLFNRFLAELRDVDVQKDPLRFRYNMLRLGEIFAYEISKSLRYANKEVISPLGTALMDVPVEDPLLATILRAGLPLHQGLLNFFDRAENAFISAYRKHHKDNTFDIQIEYLSSPSVTGKTVILSDPMLATGQSIVLGYRALVRKGIPLYTHIVSVIASTQGIEYVTGNLPENITLWIGAIDEELTASAYIVPGLGDAGDLAFGVKE
ncbi:MAG: uracil phosphoribosyltransferase [Bacteroidetes bacterium]|nr:uracil phosphoribosyltransferase [Bacteroidota bacterium]